MSDWQGSPDEESVPTTYAVRSDIEDVFGVENVKEWADLDQDDNETNIANRIVRALKAATEKLNDRLRFSYYVIPITTTPPDSIVQMTAILAGVWLYEARGIDDDEENNIIKRRAKEVYTKIHRIFSGQVALDLPKKDKGANAPIPYTD